MIKNAANLWQDMCLEEVGVDRDGDTIFKRTKLGFLAESQGLPTDAYNIGHNLTPEALGAAGPFKRLKGRENVVAFLRELADAVEKGNEL